MSSTAYRTASVEILDELREHICEVCPQNTTIPPAWAHYNVFDGNGPVYACGRHLTVAVRHVATRK